MADDEIPEVNLFGEPWNELPDRRGRKPHRFSSENRSKVRALRAAGFSRGDIADVLGISKPTLEKYYLFELNEGVAKERATAVMWLRDSAASGNVAAQKAYISLLEVGKAMVPTAPVVEDRKPERLGKKEERVLAANEAPPAEWGDLIKH